MSEIGLIERSTLSGLIEEVKRLSGSDVPLTPKQALSAVSTVVAEGVSSEEVTRILEDYLDEHLDERLDTYMDENLNGRMDKHLDDNLDKHLDIKLDDHLNEYFEENPITPKITINGEGPDENGNFNIELGSIDSNNVVEF